MEELDKEKYYSIGKINNLPNRCPILNSCLRRSWTIYIFHHDLMKNTYQLGNNEFFKEQGILSKTEEPIELAGETPSIIQGNENSYFDNACPEVLLFDNSYAISYASGIAATSAQWDKLDNPQYKILECRHYSECPEYSKYISNNTANKTAKANEKIFNGEVNIFGVKLNVMPIIRKFKSSKKS